MCVTSINQAQCPGKNPPLVSSCFDDGGGRFAYLKLVDGVGHRPREGDVSGDVGAAVEGEVEAVRASHAQLAEAFRLPVELANELLLARKVAERLGSRQVPENIAKC